MILLLEGLAGTSFLTFRNDSVHPKLSDQQWLLPSRRCAEDISTEWSRAGRRAFDALEAAASEMGRAGRMLQFQLDVESLGIAFALLGALLQRLALGASQFLSVVMYGELNR